MYTLITKIRKWNIGWPSPINKKSNRREKKSLKKISNSHRREQLKKDNDLGEGPRVLR